LHAPALAIAHLVHAPAQVDFQQVHQLVTAFSVRDLLLLAHHVAGGNVGLVHDARPDKGNAPRPHGIAQMRNAPAQRLKEGLLPQHGHRLAVVGQVLARQHAQQRGLACAIGTHEKHSGARGHIQTKVVQHPASFARRALHVKAQVQAVDHAAGYTFFNIHTCAR